MTFSSCWEHNRFNENGTWIASIVAILCLAVGGLVTAHIGRLVQDVIVSQHQQDALATLSAARAQLEGQIGAAVSLGKGFRGYVNQDHLTEDEFARFSSELIDDTQVVRSVALAPNNIIRYLYPLEGNEKAVGLDYRLNNDQWPSIREAITSRSVVVSGPVTLVQGGRALLVRIPVFPPAYPKQPVAERDYWGVATLVIDEANLVKESGFAAKMAGYDFAIISHQRLGEHENLVFGDDMLPGKDAVSLPVDFPGTLRWKLLSYPVDGWNTHGQEVWMTRVLGGVTSLVIAAMAFLLVHEVFKVRGMALHDALTGLPNRRLLEGRMQQLASMTGRTRSSFEIFYVDLDAFKPVNDNFGHTIGDQLLIEIGHRLRREIRQTDMVARVGGDEFIVLTQGGMTGEAKQSFQDRLNAQLCLPFESGELKIAVSASIGYASFPRDAGTIADLMRVADARMYDQKSQNRPSFSSAALPSPG